MANFIYSPLSFFLVSSFGVLEWVEMRRLVREGQPAETAVVEKEQPQLFEVQPTPARAVSQ